MPRPARRQKVICVNVLQPLGSVGAGSSKPDPPTVLTQVVHPFRSPESLPILCSSTFVKKRVPSSEGVKPARNEYTPYHNLGARCISRTPICYLRHGIDHRVVACSTFSKPVFGGYSSSIIEPHKT